MDDEPGPSDLPAADAVETGPAGREAPPTSRAVAMFVVVFVFFGLLAAAAWFVGGSSGSETFCTAEALLGPDGETYGRDPEQGCRFVDLDGNVLPGQ